jgi:BMFP domain-containing protein YqiC
MNDRQGLAAMDIVAVLTKVVQQQQQVVEAQRAENAELAARLARVEALLGNAEPPAAP